jgi:GNAT superfamily N-acetyltransferase
MLLRAAEPSDALAVAQVHVRSWQGAYRGLMPDDYLDGLRPQDRAEHYTFGPPTSADQPVTWVAVDGGAIQGFATATATVPPDEGPSGCGLLNALYVDPRWWGTGVGRALMVDARSRLVASGCAEAVLWVMVGNERAQGFYRTDGWEADGARQIGLVWGQPVDEVRFRRSLR